MDFRTALSDIPSGAGKKILIREVGESKEKFNTLLDFALYEKDPLAWRAAWIMDGSDEQEPGLASDTLRKMIQRLPDLESNGSLRCVLRLLSRYDIEEDDQGLLIDQCFKYMSSELYPVAVKVHAMQIIYRHVLLYPELKKELITVLRDQMDNNSVGFASRARRLIKAMDKI